MGVSLSLSLLVIQSLVYVYVCRYTDSLVLFMSVQVWATATVRMIERLSVAPDRLTNAYVRT